MSLSSQSTTPYPAGNAGQQQPVVSPSLIPEDPSQKLSSVETITHKTDGKKNPLPFLVPIVFILSAIVGALLVLVRP